ncbi:hypothetical protein FNX24_21700 [Salmonella enterica]|nr:hypothetical protein [Salmonella enterica]
MITVTIAYEVPEKVFAAINEYVANVLVRNADFSGANITIERGEYTEIDGEGRYCEVELLQGIQAIISGE